MEHGEFRQGKGEEFAVIFIACKAGERGGVVHKQCSRMLTLCHSKGSAVKPGEREKSWSRSDCSDTAIRCTEHCSEGQGRLTCSPEHGQAGSFCDRSRASRAARLTMRGINHRNKLTRKAVYS